MDNVTMKQVFYIYSTYVYATFVLFTASSYCELTFYGKEGNGNRMEVHLWEIPKGTQANVTTLS
jgi:hypothetical protein